jgi:hypothetical protein
LPPGTPTIPDLSRDEASNENSEGVRSGVLTEEGIACLLREEQDNVHEHRSGALDYADQSKISYNSCKREFLHKVAVRLDDYEYMCRLHLVEQIAYY